MDRKHVFTSHLRTIAAVMLRWADRLLTIVLGMVLGVTLLYAGYALWDNWRIYEDASVDSSLLAYKPDVDAQTANPKQTFKFLSLNPDTRAWLTVDGTNIDYPVLQGEDNYKYLNTDAYGQYSLSGSIFLDYRNSGDLSDSYSLLYGHNMAGKVMFGELKNFAKKKYFSEHQTATLYTPGAVCNITIFACLKADAYDAQFFVPGKLSQTEKRKLLTRIRSEAWQYREIEVVESDRILAMSTCLEASGNSRLIVLGKMS